MPANRERHSPDGHGKVVIQVRCRAIAITVIANCPNCGTGSRILWALWGCTRLPYYSEMLRPVLVHTHRHMSQGLTDGTASRRWVSVEDGPKKSSERRGTDRGATDRCTPGRSTDIAGCGAKNPARYRSSGRPQIVPESCANSEQSSDCPPSKLAPALSEPLELPAFVSFDRVFS